MIRNVFNAIALMAVLNLAALGGLVGFAYSRGWVEPQRVRRALAVLKGEETDAAPPAVAEKKAPAAPPRGTGELIRSNEERQERLRIELQRRESEVKKLWAHLETQQLELVRAREELEAERERYKAQREQLARREGDSGLQAEIETISGVDARTAKALLKLKDDADVVRILKAMNARKRIKIVKACKTSEERSWIERVLEKFHDSDAEQAEDLGAG
ncbi:MAG: hypothetical protein ACE5E1_02330 [Phycisphaerae bacterium]